MKRSNLVVFAILVSLHQVTSAQVDKVLTSDDGRFGMVVFSRDGKLIVAAGETGICVWNTMDGKEVFRFEGEVTTGVVQPNGTRLVFQAPSSDSLRQLDVQNMAITDLTIEREWRPRSFSADGERLLCIRDDRVQVFNVSDGRRAAAEISCEGSPADAVLFPGGNSAIAIFKGNEDVVQRIDVASGKQSATSGGFVAIDAYSQGVDVSPDGTNVAVLCSVTGKNDVGIAVLDSQRLRLRWHSEFYSVDKLKWSPDGKTIVATDSKTIRVLDATTGKVLSELRGHPSVDLAISPDGRRLCSVGDNDNVVVWDWQSTIRFREPTLTVRTHNPIVSHSDNLVPFAIAYSPDGMRVALGVPAIRGRGETTGGLGVRSSASEAIADGTESGRAETLAPYMLLIDPATGKAVDRMTSTRFRDYDGEPFGEGSTIRNLRFGYGGKLILGMLNEHCIGWNLEKQQSGFMVKATHEDWQRGWRDAALQADGRTLVMAAEDDKQGIQVFDVRTRKLISELSGETGPNLAILEGNRVVSGLTVWHLSEPKRVFRYDNDNVVFGNYRPYFTVTGLGGGRVIGTYDDAVVVWDVDSMKATKPFAVHQSGGPKIRAHAVGPKGELLATGCGDGKIRVFNIATAKLLVTLRGHEMCVDAVAFSPDGERLVSASRDGTTRFWKVGDMSDGKVPAVQADVPSHRTFDSTNGGRITVSFDRSASVSEIREAVTEFLNELKTGNSSD